jgi:serine phosphatase RsbU (regulator of sigma subunit)
MEKDSLNRFREALNNHKEMLLQWLESPKEHKHYPLNNNNGEDVLDVISQLRSALESIENGEFDQCLKCEGEVETERLELDYTTSVCLAHYSDQEIRDLESDLELASKVQKQLLPCEVPSLQGFEIAVEAEAARIVGGDYYDFFAFKDGKQGIVIADVMGKGLPASMLMSNLQASLRILGPQYGSPQQLMLKLNDLFKNNLKLIRFISIFLAKLDPENGKLAYSSAGHHPPLWYKAESQEVSWLNPTGPAIGLTADASFGLETIEVSTGDIILLYTDGLVEAQNDISEEFGEEKLRDFVLNNAGIECCDLLNGLKEAARDFAKSFQDDVTLLGLKIK